MQKLKKMAVCAGAKWFQRANVAYLKFDVPSVVTDSLDLKFENNTLTWNGLVSAVCFCNLFLKLEKYIPRRLLKYILVPEAEFSGSEPGEHGLSRHRE